MDLNSRKEDKFTVVAIDENRLDASQVNTFRDYMMELINDGKYHIILDLSQVHFMDSSGLGAVVAIRKELMKEENSTMHLAAPGAAVSDLLDLTCMDKVFSIFSSVEDALKDGQ